tara:strand:+ start:432 stop:902 length:471 start_codon:yes stop_codon:yes gene_type:complete
MAKKMKKIGMYTARGVTTEAETNAGNPQRIHLFDGRFDTGYRVVDFQIFPADFDASGSPDCIGKLSKVDTSGKSNTNFWRADDNNEIAWSGGAGSSDLYQDQVSIVDPENLIIEDLFVYVRTGGGQTDFINYIITLEKYEFSDWKGALEMAASRPE